MTMLNQSECCISVLQSCAILKFVHDIDPSFLYANTYLTTEECPQGSDENSVDGHPEQGIENAEKFSLPSFRSKVAKA